PRLRPEDDEAHGLEAAQGDLIEGLDLRGLGARLLRDRVVAGLEVREVALELALLLALGLAEVELGLPQARDGALHVHPLREEEVAEGLRLGAAARLELARRAERL